MTPTPTQSTATGDTAPVEGWQDIASIPDAEQVVVWIEGLDEPGWPMLATLYSREEPMSFVNDEGEYYPPHENGGWPTHWTYRPATLPQGDAL